MGLYDTVVFECPVCGGDIVFQSKAGQCNLDEWYPEQIPIEIARDLHGVSQTCERGCYTVKLYLPSSHQGCVHMNVSFRKENDESKV